MFKKKNSKIIVDDLIPEEERGAYRAFQANFNKKVIIFFVALIVIVVASVFGAILFQNKLSFSQNPLIQKAIPTYHAIRKFPDLLFFPYLISETKLPVYELFIELDDLKELNASLPSNPFGSDSLNNLPRVYVSGSFKSGEYEDKVDVRYRGSLGDHWNSYQKSFRIVFPDDHLFKGMTETNVIIPSNRIYFAPALNDYRGKKLGLTVPDEKYVWLKLNGNDMGVYLLWEQWSTAWIEKKAISSASQLFGTRHIEGATDQQLFEWKSWTHKGENFPELETLLNIANNTNEEDFKKLVPHIIDLEKIYGMSVINILSQSYHNYFNNLVLLYNATTGKFEVVPNHTAIFEEYPEDRPDYFVQRILSYPDFREEIQQRFDKYVESEKNNDLDFVDRWIKELRPELYKDQAKLENNFTLRNFLNDTRDIVIANFDDPAGMILQMFDIEIPEETNLILPPSFKYLEKIIISPQQFVRESQQFYLQNDGIHIGPGIVTISRDTVIPADSKLIIEPGTTLRMEKDTSLFSYSPVIANGTEEKYIKVESAKKNSPWGVFAVLNQTEESIFTYVDISGGSEEQLGGIPITGMLALHNAPVIIENSLFTKAEGDDAVNIKGTKGVVRNNLFKDNASDAIDLDFVSDDTVVEANTFEGNFGKGGDAIDLSWSNITIKNNSILGCGDKGVSVGESSRPHIINNIIFKCTIGVAVKDSSKAEIVNTIFIQNETAISAYNKKAYFEGGEVITTNNTFFKNGQNFDIDIMSSVEDIDNNVLEVKQSLKQIIPAKIFETL